MWNKLATLAQETVIALGIAILGIICAGLAGTVMPIERLDIGTTYAQPYITGFHGLERNRQFSYSFTKAEASISLPGIGSS